ncbi:hypothetical protein QAD02_007511 [Eretmocerus hayati]|uniref:Uncharacterized protein n=1 Tax=Eretmocerus hayati TaxID=131215 RepID=A0ACC2N454_9HYME|nr:hypothetical protein QAD02_007511 [Eretmocerus hayati]
MKCQMRGCDNWVKYRFPQNLELRKLWLIAIQQPSFMPKRSHGLCLEHFHPEQFYSDSDANTAENNINDDKINGARSDESSTANTAESCISGEKISVASCKVPRKSQKSGGSH